MPESAYFPCATLRRAASDLYARVGASLIPDIFSILRRGTMPHRAAAAAELQAFLLTATPDQRETAERLLVKLLSLREADLSMVEAVADLALARRAPQPPAEASTTPPQHSPTERRVATTPRLALVMIPHGV
jgi:hypothetical protein